MVGCAASELPAALTPDAVVEALARRLVRVPDYTRDR
jgi:hypothetical protein